MKHTFFNPADLPIHVDEFVRKHIDFIVGAAILKNSNHQNNSQEMNAKIVEQSGSEIDKPSYKTEKYEDLENKLEVNNNKCSSQKNINILRKFPKIADANPTETAIENWQNLVQRTSKKKKTHFRYG